MFCSLLGDGYLDRYIAELTVDAWASLAIDCIGLRGAYHCISQGTPGRWDRFSEVQAGLVL